MSDLPQQSHRPPLQCGSLALCLAALAGCHSLPQLPWSGDHPVPEAAAAETWRDDQPPPLAIRVVEMRGPLPPASDDVIPDSPSLETQYAASAETKLFRQTAAEEMFGDDGRAIPSLFERPAPSVLPFVAASAAAPPVAEGYPPSLTPQAWSCGAPHSCRPPERFTLREDVCNLWPMLRDDTLSVINWRNAIILGAAAGGAVAIRKDADGDVREQTAYHPNRWGDATDRLRYFGEASVQMPVIMSVYGYSLWRQDAELHSFSVALISAHAITSITTVTLKGLTDTQRPDPEHYGGHWGFPSYHTSSSFAIAATVDEYYGWKAGVPAYVLAGLVGWSRIDGREHDLSDVVFGSVLGFVIGKSVAAAHLERDMPVQITPYYDPVQQAGGVMFEAPF